MLRLFRHQELIKPFQRQDSFQRKLLIRHYHLEPGEENLCLIAKSYNDLEMEVRTVMQPKENEVLIRVGSCCLSAFDFDYLTRFYGKDTSQRNSVVLGSFGSGIVIKTGAGVNELFSEGDRVALEPGIFCNKCTNCLAGKTNLCQSISYLGSQGRDGALCRFINHPINFTHKLEKNVSLEVATLSTKIAACISSYKRAHISKDSKVLIMGTSLTGLVAIMVIKHLGVGTIFVTETNNYRLKLARTIGADYVIKMSSLSSPEHPEYLKEIISSIHSGEPDVVIDTIGTASSLESSFHLSKSGGRVVLMNLMARPIQARFLYATLREIDLIGAFTYTHESFKEAIKFLTNDQVPFKKILPVKIPLEKALDAFSHGRATGAENLFIIVNNYIEKEKRAMPVSGEPKTAGIPKLKPHQEIKPISTENLTEIEEKVKQGQEKSLSKKSTTTETGNEKTEKVPSYNGQLSKTEQQVKQSHEKVSPTMTTTPETAEHSQKRKESEKMTDPVETTAQREQQQVKNKSEKSIPTKNNITETKHDSQQRKEIEGRKETSHFPKNQHANTYTVYGAETKKLTEDTSNEETKIGIYKEKLTQDEKNKNSEKEVKENTSLKNQLEKTKEMQDDKQKLPKQMLEEKSGQQKTNIGGNIENKDNKKEENKLDTNKKETNQSSSKLSPSETMNTDSKEIKENKHSDISLTSTEKINKDTSYKKLKNEQNQKESAIKQEGTPQHKQEERSNEIETEVDKNAENHNLSKKHNK